MSALLAVAEPGLAGRGAYGPRSPAIADFPDASAIGLAQVFAWPTFGRMLIGMALGFVVGPWLGLGS